MLANLNEFTIYMEDKTTDDVFGRALMDHLIESTPENLIVHSDITEPEIYPIEHFFRTFESFPELEKKAMRECQGKVLDVGAGSGIHSLYLQEVGMDVTAIDISAICIDIMKKRGITNARHQDFFDIKHEKYDTLLMMMNGFGIMGRVQRIDAFFTKAKTLLKDGGQILFDSSDLIYLFEEEDGSYLIDLSKGYYGEVTFQMEYKGEKGTAFPWLFADFHLIEDYAEKNGFKAEKLMDGENFHYLARLTLK